MGGLGYMMAFLLTVHIASAQQQPQPEPADPSCCANKCILTYLSPDSCSSGFDLALSDCLLKNSALAQRCLNNCTTTPQGCGAQCLTPYLTSAVQNCSADLLKTASCLASSSGTAQSCVNTCNNAATTTSSCTSDCIARYFESSSGECTSAGDRYDIVHCIAGRSYSMERCVRYCSHESGCDQTDQTSG